jgi:hypothetical protein
LTWTLLAAFATPTLFGALAQTLGYDFAWRALALFEIFGVIPALLASRAIANQYRDLPARPAAS